MSDRDDDEFSVRLGAPRPSRSSPTERFAARVRRAAGGIRSGGPRRAGIAQGRGQVAARVAGRSLGANARRVVVKVRLVRLRGSSARSVATHLRYLEREGVGSRGEPGHAYDASNDRTDLGAFQERGAGDRHQFRVILAPEDGAALGDLRTYVRQWMKTVQQDLGTSLDWVAVDHWNTDNPHAHIVLRGKDVRGADLVIAPDYLAQGLRARASELATRWLGPRTEREITESFRREVTQERWTRLDQSIHNAQRGGTLRLAAAPQSEHFEPLLRGRIDTLARLGLAQRVDADTWTLRPDWEATLRQFGERGDIIRTLQRSMGSDERELAIFDAGGQGPAVVGRIAGKGLADELSEQGYLAVDGTDGRAHYVVLPPRQVLEDFPVGAIVEARPGAPRTIDEQITRSAEGGIYRAERVADPTTRLHQQRRLEALRRGGIVDRIAEGVWQVPADLPARGRVYDTQHLGAATLTLRSHSHSPIEQQIRAVGATWLDQQLVTGRLPSTTGFGAQVREALAKREQFLVEQGLAQPQGRRIVLANGLLATLRGRELSDVAGRLQSEIGLPHRPVVDGERIDGVYRRSLQLASGPYALIDDGSSFALVPWRPVIEAHLGRSVSATVTGQRVSWNIGNQRDWSR
jgi:type IV secretory pathway VirD2 relaxase